MKKKYIISMKISPKKSLGQNFLHDPKILGKITDAADLTKEDVVLEVGPGTGNLTKILSEKAGRVIAIEKDHRTIDELRSVFSSANVEIFEGDTLEINPRDLGLKEGGYKIVANIPYYITSNFIRQVLEFWPKPKLVVITIQKEVAQRIVAKPPHMNLLALSVQFYSNPKIVDYISAGSFFPKPNVDSAIIKLTPKEAPLDPTEAKRYFSLLKSAFAEKRKQLAKVAGQKEGIPKEAVAEILGHIGIRQDARPEILSQDQWLALLKCIDE
ncbi:MAG TPA: ribosomal RNA small subunit methyltransferase A [Candidatus Yanofskybacteria bacterium]|nr:ribosomal RNA small subunit methyltransferase A [Candidatus Yanofskybacteria bacterium]